MAFKTVFNRYELKYLLTQEQKEKIVNAISEYMALDNYGKSTIRNLYFDTENYRLIRRSLEKPLYKEKLRIRSYTQAKEDSLVFVELKKKYNGVVYKRRLPLKLKDATEWTCCGGECPVNTQISREINYFMDFYGELSPKVFLSYNREAYFDKNGLDFRVTFDTNVRFRQSGLDLSLGTFGKEILPLGFVLMELKCNGGIPLYMAQILSKEGIYKTSFSKYGSAYSNYILPNINNPPQKEIIENGCLV